MRRHTGRRYFAASEQMSGLSLQRWADEIEEFFEKCDFYFDMNQGTEVLSSVRQAFLHNNLIFAFEGTAHNRDFVVREHVYAEDGVMRMLSEEVPDLIHMAINESDGV